MYHYSLALSAPFPSAPSPGWRDNPQKPGAPSVWLVPCGWLLIPELFGDREVTGIPELAQMYGEVSPRKAKRFLDEPVGNASRARLGDQQRHYSKSSRLVDGLLKDNRFVSHATPLLRIHTVPSATTSSVATADTARAASPAR